MNEYLSSQKAKYFALITYHLSASKNKPSSAIYYDALIVSIATEKTSTRYPARVMLVNMYIRHQRDLIAASNNNKVGVFIVTISRPLTLRI